MDPRQPQHPFSARNTASPYGQHARPPFPTSANQAPFPPSSHPPAAPSYGEHQRRPSDPPYYPQQRTFGQDGPPMAGPGHARHQSASSINHGTPVHRNMPPPSSPQQQAPQPSHHYGPPPPPRAPPGPVGPPTNFPNPRELPTLPPLGGPRPPSTGSSMSISSMLGGPAASREPTLQYSPVTTSGPPPNPRFGAQGSPQMRSAANDYAPYRRPVTPEVGKYGPRDHRANSAGSPPNMGQQYTPESRRFGTPQQQGYGQRVAMEERREPIRVQNPNVPPPRPNSQPTTFSNGPQRVPDSRPMQNDGVFGRRVENFSRASEQHNRAEPGYRPAFEERQNVYGFAEREKQERQDRESILQRERERVDREREREREAAQQHEREARERQDHERNMQQEILHQLAQRNAQAGYNRPPEPPREQQLWNRPNYEQPRPEYDHPPQQERRFEHQQVNAPQYSGPPPFHTNVDRYGPPPTSLPQQSAPPPQYEMSLHDRLRLAQEQQQQQQQQLQYGGPPPSQEYQPNESPQRRAIEDAQQLQQQRNFLGVQELNRKGRVSPLPQAVQGVQGQLNGPGGQPSIKNEFGRMFSGIGSGVGAMGASPVSAGPQSMPFSNPGQLRREDLEHLQDSPIESGGHKVVRSASRGGRRRKLKEEDSRGDDEISTGRNTPSGRGKRAKTHHHHHHHHHHHRPDADNATSPSLSTLTPFKNVRGSAIPSPPGQDGKASSNVHHHHVPRHHHHHASAKPVPQPIVPLAKLTVRSQAVLDSVAHLSRHNLGHGYYKSRLATRSFVKRNLASNRGFASTPEPLPDFADKQNSTYTIKVPPIYLDPTSREEITRRKAVWGTDIYTDDSDIIAACIHQGWFRGAWPDDVDISLLDLDIPPTSNAVQQPTDVNALISSPPATGPIEVPENRECHITILVLPALEAYASTVRFGIMSREWGVSRHGSKSVHDGLSFMIQSIKWVSVADGQEARTGSSRSKIFAQQLDDQELLNEQAEAEFLQSGTPDSNGRYAESNVRGGGEGFTGIGTKSWWQKPLKPVKSMKEKDREKQKEREKSKSVVEPPVMSPISPIVRPPVQSLTPPPVIKQPLFRGVDKQEALIGMVTARMVANVNSGSLLPLGGEGEARSVDGGEMRETDQGGMREEDTTLEETLDALRREKAVREREGMAAAILAFGLDKQGGSVGSIPL